MYLKYKIVFFILITLIVSCSSNKVKKSDTSNNIKLTNQNINFSETVELKKLINILIHPGEVRIFSLKAQPSDDYEVLCGKKNIKSDYYNNRLVFVIAESYFSKKNAYECYINKDKVRQTLITVKVNSRKYLHEKLNVDKKRVQLSAKNLKRYLREKKLLTKKYKLSSQKLMFTKPFTIPLNSKVTSIYGTKRIFNNHKHTQHLGTDFRAKVGTPIPATNSGKIIFAGDLFFTGGTVIINHGLGIYSIYGHLSKLLVTENQKISRGQIVALSGKSGRVTGPHLHWGLKISGQYIDGISMIKESQIFKENE